MCVRELSKKTAVSHDRAGFGSPLTAQANLCKVKTLIQKKFILTQRNNMSKIAQTEYKVKARFQTLLRCSRFSRRSLNEHCKSSPLWDWIAVQS